MDSKLLGIILNKAGQEDVDVGSYYRYEATAETAERLEAERAEAERRAAARRRSEPADAAARAAPRPRAAAPPVEKV